MSPEARIQALRDAPPNGWVAFTANEEEVVAYGTTYDEVVTNAEKKGVVDIVVVKVPKDWADMVLTA